jgi:hypothetical protein
VYNWTVPSLLKVMAKVARDSAYLHEAHGEPEEAARWASLADMWEVRACNLAEGVAQHKIRASFGT